jgi:C4-dicarboxylate transporter, DctQ subunit
MNDQTLGPSENRLFRWLHRVEDGLLLLALVSMIAMAVLQILLRVLFHTGVVWGDQLVRVLVLWLGLLGAVSASRNDSHIRIDLVSRYLPERFKAGAGGVTQLATALICGATAWFGGRFVLMEFEYQGQAFAAVPVWVCELIIPLGFAVIALRYIMLSLNRFQTIFRKSS